MRLPVVMDLHRWGLCIPACLKVVDASIKAAQSIGSAA
jgi:hypothetical protein